MAVLLFMQLGEVLFRLNGTLTMDLKITLIKKICVIIKVKPSIWSYSLYI